MIKLGDIINFAMFVFLTVFLLFNILLCIYINSELLINIDKYVSVYNDIYGTKNNDVVIFGTIYIGSKLKYYIDRDYNTLANTKLEDLKLDHNGMI